MRIALHILAVTAALAGAGAVAAQEAVTGVPNPDALFTDKDPALNRNKQAAYHIVKDLLEANQWDKAGQWLTPRYLQHNPLARSGLQGVIDYFTKVAKRQPSPVPEKMATRIVAVVADKDYVIVVYPRAMDQSDPAKAYTTTWFDMWRFVDGKADEHWDPATRP